MSGAEVFVTFGLPAIAIGWALIMLRASQKSAARIDDAEHKAAATRFFG